MGMVPEKLQIQAYLPYELRKRIGAAEVWQNVSAHLDISAILKNRVRFFYDDELRLGRFSFTEMQKIQINQNILIN